MGLLSMGIAEFIIGRAGYLLYRSRISRRLSSGAFLRDPLAHAGYLLALNVHAKGKSASDDQDGRGRYRARSIPHVTATGM
jgi:hypothetical protein